MFVETNNIFQILNKDILNYIGTFLHVIEYNKCTQICKKNFFVKKYFNTKKINISNFVFNTLDTKYIVDLKYLYPNINICIIKRSIINFTTYNLKFDPIKFNYQTLSDIRDITLTNKIIHDIQKYIYC